MKGYRTYLVAAAMALYAVTGFALGKLDFTTAFALLSNAGGFAGLRASK